MAWSFRHHYFPYARKSTSAMRVDFDEDDFAISDLEDSTEDDEETPDLTKDDSDVLRRRVVHLPLSVEYVPRWQPQDAFRELYQNWKDGIVESFGVDPRSIRPSVTETRSQIQITFYRTLVSNVASAPELLGYILFKKKVGSLEITNFKARLERRHLDLGQSSKRNNQALAGCHGEGFKLAALVMCRNGHSVKFQTNSCNWNFSFRGAHPRLSCFLSPHKPETLQKKRSDYSREAEGSNFTRGTKANIWEDVSVIIQKPAQNRSTWTGGQVLEEDLRHQGIREGAKISEEDFRQWMTVSLDLDPPPPEQIVRTGKGDLILDKAYQGKIYLRGLLVAGVGNEDSDYSFAYNFPRGEINRDREMLASRGDEARMLAQIWEAAILLKGDDITDHYIKLFSGENPEACRDILKAADHVSLYTAQKILKRLKFSHPDAFFYSTGVTSQPNIIKDEDIILRYLQKTPFKIQKQLWKILRAYHLVRTPHEERKKLFESSQTVDPASNAFCLNVVRTLKASLQLDPRLKTILIEFVGGGDTNIDLLYTVEQNLLRVHQKWLNFHDAHQVANCELSRISGTIDDHNVEDEAFYCDHVVQELLEAAIHEVSGPLGLKPDESDSLRRRAIGCLREMARGVRLSAPELGGQLEVDYAGNESGRFAKRYGASIYDRVTLHKTSTCSAKKEEVLELLGDDEGHLEDDPRENSNSDKMCDCPSVIVSRASSKAVFSGLDHRESYFAMVSRLEHPSFFALPPLPMAPKKAALAGREGLAEPVMVSSSLGSTIPGHTNNENESGGVLDWSIDESVDSGGDDILDDANARTLTPVQTTTSQDTPRRQLHADLPHMRSRSSPMTGNHDAADLLLQDDEKTWMTWYNDQLPQAFSSFLPRRYEAELTGSPVWSVECESLGYTFEKGEYARIHMNGEETDQIVFVHNILQADEESNSQRCLLVVTRYSFLSATYPFQTLPEASHSNREMVLHFRDFDRMRTQDDAEVIMLEDILSAQDVATGPHGIKPVLDIPQGIDTEFFCRFAIRNTGTESVACITPLASSAFLHGDQWKPPKFAISTPPVAFELTPNILGAAEGFVQAGFQITAALGFDEERHGTWKARHNTSQVFDGPLPGISDDLDSGKLLPLRTLPPPRPLPPRRSEPVQPAVAFLAGEHQYFRLDDRNCHMPTVQHFTQVLDIVDQSFEALHPNFVAMLMPPALLHPLALGKCVSTILGLLGKRMSVHLKLTPLSDYGIPQQRSILTIIASPFRAPLPWGVDRPDRGPQPSLKVADVIGDLVFDNPRALPQCKTGFVCSPPTQGEHASLGRYVYNHITGQAIRWNQEPIEVDVDSVLTPFNGAKSWLHPTRRDRLTVRELARIQGFSDDFVFLGSQSSQYEDVCRAIPPIVAERAAQTILGVIRSALMVRVTGFGGAARANKRARVDDGEVDD